MGEISEVCSAGPDSPTVFHEGMFIQSTIAVVLGLDVILKFAVVNAWALSLASPVNLTSAGLEPASSTVKRI
jgi:hypothetical protein